MAELFLRRFEPRQETEKRPRGGGSAAAGELLRDALGDPKNIPGVLVVIFHQRLVPQRAAFLRITEPFGHLVLDGEMEGVGGAPGRVMEISTEAQQKIVGGFDSPAIGLAQPILADEVGRGERAFLEERHPKQVLVIAQSAAAAFQVRFQHVNAVAELRMARRLVLHAQLHVFALPTAHTLLPERSPEPRRQMRIARQRARLEHRGLRQHVLVRQVHRFRDRARGVAHFEPNIPEQIKDLLNHLGRVSRNVSPVLVVQEHNVDVAEWIELPASITAESNDGKWGGGHVFFPDAGRGFENVTQQHVDHFDPERADFPAASTILMAQSEPMLLDFQEPLVERKRICRPHRPGLFRGDEKPAFWILDCGFWIARKLLRRLIENRKSKIQNGNRHSSIA